MSHFIGRFMNHYFPSKLLETYGLSAIFFIVSTFYLYLIFDLVDKILKNPPRLWGLKPMFPIVLFTPSVSVIVGRFDFSVLAFINEIYTLEGYTKLSDYKPRCGWVVIDGGANAGIFSLYSAHYNPKLIISLEPDPRNYRRLTTTLELNRLSNIKAIPYAIAGENGYQNFLLSQYTFSSGITKQACVNKTIQVKTVSLSTLMHAFKLSHIDLLKLDVEGAEYSIIASSETILSAGRVKRIVGEIHGSQQEMGALVKRIEALGFTTEHIVWFPQTATIHLKYDHYVGIQSNVVNSAMIPVAFNIN